MRQSAGPTRIRTLTFLVNLILKRESKHLSGASAFLRRSPVKFASAVGCKAAAAASDRCGS
jgi:hypothetical protein